MLPQKFKHKSFELLTPSVHIKHYYFGKWVGMTVEKAMTAVASRLRIFIGSHRQQHFSSYLTKELTWTLIRSFVASAHNSTLRWWYHDDLSKRNASIVVYKCMTNANGTWLRNWGDQGLPSHDIAVERRHPKSATSPQRDTKSTTVALPWLSILADHPNRRICIYSKRKCAMITELGP